MRISLRWLRELCPVLLSDDEMAQRLTFAGLEVEGREDLPHSGPLLVLTNHASVLDPPALLAADPYPDSLMLAKASLFGLRQGDTLAPETMERKTD